MLNTCAEAREVSKLRTEKIEPQIRACVQSYKLQLEMRKHFVHEHPEVSSSWEMPEVQSLINDPRVYSIDGLMCRWSLRTRGSKNKEFMRKRTRWLTSSKEIAASLSHVVAKKRNTVITILWLSSDDDAHLSDDDERLGPKRSPNAPKFEGRSQEETEWQEQSAREAAVKLAKSVNTTPHMTRFRDVKVCINWLQKELTIT